MSAETIVVEKLGAQGDGFAGTSAGPVHVPFALPGETVSIAREKSRGTLLAVKSAVPGRVEPPCPHFGPDGEGGACGGCALQHFERAAYETWKHGLVTEALAAERLDVDVAPLQSCLPGERRRVALSARHVEGGLHLGFRQGASHRIVDMRVCPVASSGIERSLPAIRAVAAAMPRGEKPFRVTVLETAVGLDLAFEEVARLDETRRRKVVEAVLAQKVVARASVNDEVLVAPRRPAVDFGGVEVEVPPGGFLQASARAEALMAGYVCEHLAGEKRIADLFSGSGSFALRLARQAAVHAVESDAAALASLDGAFRKTSGLKPVTVERRDLFRRPLTATDLKPYGGLVFDPPRAGAEAEAREIARSDVRRVAAVSCNPSTLARDLRVLVAGGYRIVAVRPVDQFLWSAHVEVVALLERP